MTKDNFKIVLPDDAAGKFKVHDVLRCANNNRPPILTLIHDMSATDASHVVRLYTSTQENDEVIFDYELEAVALPTYESAVEFANRIPTLSALELLLMQNEIYDKLTQNPTILQ